MAEEVKPVSTDAPAPVVPVTPESAPVKAEAPVADPAKAVDKPVDGAPKVEAPAPKVVPEKYDLKLSQDSLVDATSRERIEAHAKAQGLSNEEAQALLTSEEQRVHEYVETQKAAWLAEAQADKEIGGERLKESAEYAKRALVGFKSEKLMQELDRFGYGNHPEVIRFLSKVGRLMADDRFIHAGITASGEKKSIEQVLYGGSEG